MIDSHAHLQADAFAGDLEAVLTRAAAAGVWRILVPGWDLDSSRAAVALCRTGTAPGTGRPWLAAAVGVHPHAAGSQGRAEWAAITELARDPAVVAIGETGLDYDRLHSARDAQLENLRRHVALALTLGKPLVLHCRSARGRRDAQDALLAELVRGGLGSSASAAVFGERPAAVLHSFSGPPAYAADALELGLAVSFSGLVFRNGEEGSAAVASAVPRERLLVETDAPYLSPPGAPRRRNEPRWVHVTTDWLACQRELEVAPLERDLEENFARIFGPPEGA